MTTMDRAMPGDASSHVAKDSPDAMLNPKPTNRPRPASPCADQARNEAQSALVGAPPCPDHRSPEAQWTNVEASLRADHRTREVQNQSVGASTNGHHSHSDAPTATVVDAQRQPIDAASSSLEPAGAELLLAASFLDDVEKVRIATGERLRSTLVARGYLQKKAKASSKQLIAIAAKTELAVYGAQLQAMLKLEHQAALALRRVMRRHPLGSWVKRTQGVGDKQAARLIAAIGPISYKRVFDDEKNVLELPRRGPAELWAYCGFRPDQRRRKGAQSNWDAQSKMRAFLVAKSCMKNRRSPYRAVYEHARAKWAEKDTSELHKMNHALRCAAKAMLRDLFIEARAVGA